ncbi:hypothetical protein E2562_038268 [Oryza meyeriana var. granulata]|uniref:Uncharacterized protein n=1 Tax=Oryza meyeriana var. granulata TaxID=110450 RepID=A0A6G1F282_9ORYZ|nr:hypothetical protein E2562_038268 [Oryza meyeriana var. granulata]
MVPTSVTGSNVWLGQIHPECTVFGPVDSAPSISDVLTVPTSMTGSNIRPGLLHPKHHEGLSAMSHPSYPQVAKVCSPRGDG